MSKRAKTDGLRAVLGDVAKDCEDLEFGGYNKESIAQVKAVVDAVNKEGKRCQVVHMPMDEQPSQAHVDNVRKLMPTDWLQAPLDPEGAEEGVVGTLAETYDLTEFPEILVFGRDGKLISQSDSVTRFFFDATPEDQKNAVARFPWAPLTLKDAISKCTFTRGDDSTVNLDAIKGSTVAFLFSSSGEHDNGVKERKRPESKEVATKLAGMYDEVCKTGKKFEVVYVPMEHNSDHEHNAQVGNAFEAHRKSMPAAWLHAGDITKKTVLYDDPNTDALALGEAILDGAQGGLPELGDNGPRVIMVRFEADEPVVLNPNATCQLLREGAKGFPWKLPAVRDLDQAIEDDPDVIERSPFVLAWLPKEGSAAVEAAVLKVAQAEEARGGLRFFTTVHGEDNTAASLLDTVGILPTGEVDASFEGEPFGVARKQWFREGQPFVLVFDMQDFPSAYASAIDFTKNEVDVTAFVASYRNGGLHAQKIEPMSAEEMMLQAEMAENEEEDEEEVDLGSEDTDDGE